MSITADEVCNLMHAAQDAPDQGIGAPDHPALAALNERALSIARLAVAQHRDILKLRRAFAHEHVNNPESNGDDCAQCGLDLRNPVHSNEAHQTRTDGRCSERE